MSKVSIILDPRHITLDRHDVALMLKCGESKVRSLQANPKFNFPEPLRTSSNSTPVWLTTDIIEWMMQMKEDAPGVLGQAIGGAQD